MAWLYLIGAGLLEVAWSTTMKLSNGFTHPLYMVLTIAGQIASFVGLALAMKEMPLNLAYPIWTGIGALGAIIVGVVCFQNHLSPATAFFTVLLLVAIVGIKVTSGE